MGYSSDLPQTQKMFVTEERLLQRRAELLCQQSVPEPLLCEFMASVFFAAFGSRRETFRGVVAALMDERMRSLFVELIFCILRYSKHLLRI